MARKNTDTKSIVATDAIDGRLINRLLTAFERAAHTDDNGNKYWLAREYGPLLGYPLWRNFQLVIDRARAACEAEGGSIEDHFAHVRKVITGGKGSQQNIDDYELTRRACYLIALNGDPRKKEEIAAAQQYFVEQTYKQEILEQATSDVERLDAHKKVIEAEGELELESKSRGVSEHGYQTVRNAGHRALFNKSPEAVKVHLQVPDGRDIADFVQPVVANAMSFATALTTHQTRINDLDNASQIARANEDNHGAVRKIMVDRQTLPEKLPPAGDIREVRSRVEKQKAKLIRKAKTREG